MRALAQETGPTAKIVIANGHDLDELDPHYFKSIPSYYAVANLYDNMFAHEYTTQEDGGLFPVQDEDGQLDAAAVAGRVVGGLRRQH